MDAIPELHLLEQVASEQHIGTLAENLLEAMAQHPPCFAEVSHVYVSDCIASDDFIFFPQLTNQWRDLMMLNN